MVEAVSARIEGDDTWCVPLAESLPVARNLTAVAAAAG